jgi:hypothetical protein
MEEICAEVRRMQHKQMGGRGGDVRHKVVYEERPKDLEG